MTEVNLIKQCDLENQFVKIDFTELKKCYRRKEIHPLPGTTYKFWPSYLEVVTPKMETFVSLFMHIRGIISDLVTGTMSRNGMEKPKYLVVPRDFIDCLKVISMYLREDYDKFIECFMGMGLLLSPSEDKITVLYGANVINYINLDQKEKHADG